MLETQSCDELGTVVLIGDLCGFGDFDALDYASTPQVSPSTLINGVDVISDLDVDQAEDEPISPEPIAGGSKDIGAVPRYRRLSHVRAEKKRRSKIQEQLRTLHNDVPTLPRLSTFAKLSELDTVVEAGKHIKDLQTSQRSRHSDITILRRELENLKRDFDRFQSDLPTSGIEKKEKKITMEDRYGTYRSEMMTKDWTFGIFDRLVASRLFGSYVDQTGSETCPSGYLKKLMEWTGSKLSLTHLRPEVITGLRDIATNTNFLRNPNLIRQEICAHKSSSSTVSVVPNALSTDVVKGNTDKPQNQETSKRITTSKVTGTGSGSESGTSVAYTGKSTGSATATATATGKGAATVISPAHLSVSTEGFVETLVIDLTDTQSTETSKDVATSVTQIGTIIPIFPSLEQDIFIAPVMKAETMESMDSGVESVDSAEACSEASSKACCTRVIRF